MAIKIIPLGDASEMEEVQREITMLQECNHPNVVRYMVRNAPMTSLSPATGFPAEHAGCSALNVRFALNVRVGHERILAKPLVFLWRDERLSLLAHSKRRLPCNQSLHVSQVIAPVPPSPAASISIASRYNCQALLPPPVPRPFHRQPYPKLAIDEPLLVQNTFCEHMFVVGRREWVGTAACLHACMSTRTSQSVPVVGRRALGSSGT